MSRVFTDHGPDFPIMDYQQLCLSGAKSPARRQSLPQRQPLPLHTGFNTRYLAGNRAGALGATALVPGELRAALAPSRLLLLVHAFISWPTWSTSSAGGCAALGDCKPEKPRSQEEEDDLDLFGGGKVAAAAAASAAQQQRQCSQNSTRRT